MSDEDIRREFLQARDPKKQLKILADENCCSVGTILRIVNEKRKQEAELSGFVPIQALAEKEAEKEKDGVEEYDFGPLPSAPPQAAADFDELGPSSLPDVQDIPEAGAAEGTEDGSVPHQSPSATASPRGSREDAAAENADLRGIVRNLADGGWVPTVKLPAADPKRYFLTEGQCMELWFILGQLRGVLDASAEAGKPGEVMKDAVSELESLLRSLN